MPFRERFQRGIDIWARLLLTLLPPLDRRSHNPKFSGEVRPRHIERLSQVQNLGNHAGMSANCTPIVKCLLHSPGWQKSAMGTVAERLKQARELAGFDGPAEAARALDISRFTYTQHENGTRGFKHDAAIRYARRFRVSLEWLLTGKGAPRGMVETGVPVTSYVGAGAEVIPFPDQGALDYIATPPGFEDCEAAIIRGDSMPPFQDGWIIIWRRENSGVVDTLAGKLCMVSVKDGPALVKVLRRSRKRGLWNLESWNAPLRENVALDWAAPVVDIRPY